MNLLSTKIHAYVDYILGTLLIATPWIFGFATAGASTYVPVILGISIILYSLLTNYELSQARMIKMRHHLMLDALAGLLLIASPWLFGFENYVWQPHVIVGSIAVVLALISRREPGVRRPPPEQLTRDNNISRTAVH